MQFLSFFESIGYVSTLSSLIFLSFFLLLFISSESVGLLRHFSLSCSVFIFLFSLSGFLLLDSTGLFSAREQFVWLAGWNIDYYLGVDSISLYFIVLSTFLIPVCIIASWESIKYRMKEFLLLLFFVEFCLVNVFSVLDLLLFYLFFEAVIIPMFIIIGVWGSRLRRISASFRFFLYTLAGSVFMLIALLYIYVTAGSFNLYALYDLRYPLAIQIPLWLAFFCSFSVKIPMFPFHVWLPEAHVEAPTAGSVLLAGILLKLGGYGFLRFSLPLFPEASVYLAPFVFLLSLLAILYGSLTTIVQVDLKKIIAYSSVAHMNFVTLGLFTNSLEGIEGAIFLMLSHGLVSSALFLCVGFLYDRHGSRLLRYYGGLATLMPIYSSFLFLFMLANLGLPGTSSFVAEFLVLIGGFCSNSFVGVVASIGVILSAVYNVWFYNRLCGGPISPALTRFSDINRRETILLFSLAVPVIYLGIKPDYLLSTLHLPVSFLLY
jgi:proton-translocating NADH-quinone oxidoreductase chain M